jgi:hypothetical protein
MKLPVITLLPVAVLLVLVTSARAERWCSAGPDQVPDHPCAWYIEIANHALEGVKPAWSKLEGVGFIGVITSRGDYVEIAVNVTPEFFMMSDPLPEFVAGVPVRIYTYFLEWTNDAPSLPSNAQTNFEASKHWIRIGPSGIAFRAS